MSSSKEAGAEASVTYEDLAQLEHEFDQVDLEILRQQYKLSRELYARRKDVVSRIAGFWPLVLESAPPEIDRYIQPSDSEIFAKCLTSIEVDRFELEVQPDGTVKGDPRSITIRFEFSDNEWFDDKTIEKQLWWRRASDGWTGLVSRPVRIHWKKGKDPTKGLMDGAVKLWEARERAGDMKRRDLPEFDQMAKLTETWNGDNTSFFTWFAFMSAHRWVSAKESETAESAEVARQRRVADGTERAAVLMPEEDHLEAQVEAHEEGDGLATVFAEDLWPGAIKYFTQAQENAELSDDDFEEDEDEDEDEDDEVDEDDQGHAGGADGQSGGISGPSINGLLNRITAESAGQEEHARKKRKT